MESRAGAHALLGPRGTLTRRSGHKCTEDVHRALRSSSQADKFPRSPPRLPSFCDSVSFFFLSPLRGCRHRLCAEACIFASSPMHCIMNASLGHAWKHMWQDGLLSSRCARFQSTCRASEGGGERGRMVRRRKKKRI